MDKNKFIVCIVQCSVRFCCRLPIILEYSVAQSGMQCVSVILIRDTSSGDCFVVVISFTRITFYLIFNTVNMWLYFLSRAVVCYCIPFFPQSVLNKRMVIQPSLMAIIKCEMQCPNENYTGLCSCYVCTKMQVQFATFSFALATVLHCLQLLCAQIELRPELKRLIWQTQNIRRNCEATSKHHIKLTETMYAAQLWRIIFVCLVNGYEYLIITAFRSVLTEFLAA